MKENLTEGLFVTFYDSQKANADKYYKGDNLKYYPCGKIIKIYWQKGYGEYSEKLADIERKDGSISKGHFISVLKIVTPQPQDFI